MGGTKEHYIGELADEINKLKADLANAEAEVERLRGLLEYAYPILLHKKFPGTTCAYWEHKEKLGKIRAELEGNDGS